MLLKRQQLSCVQIVKLLVSTFGWSVGSLGDLTFSPLYPGFPSSPARPFRPCREQVELSRLHVQINTTWQYEADDIRLWNQWQPLKGEKNKQMFVFQPSTYRSPWGAWRTLRSHLSRKPLERKSNKQTPNQTWLTRCITHTQTRCHIVNNVVQVLPLTPSDPEDLESLPDHLHPGKEDKYAKIKH